MYEKNKTIAHIQQRLLGLKLNPLMELLENYGKYPPRRSADFTNNNNNKSTKAVAVATGDPN